MRAVLAIAAVVSVWAIQPDPAQAYGGCAVFGRGHYDCGQAKYYYGSPIYRRHAPEYVYFGPRPVYEAVPPPPPVVIYVAPLTYDRYYSAYAAPEPIYIRPRRSGCGRYGTWYGGGCHDAGYRW